VDEDLTQRQRRVFVALVAQLGSNHNAIYKTLFDARRKLRAALAANGYPTNTAASADVVSVDGGEGRRS